MRSTSPEIRDKLNKVIRESRAEGIDEEETGRRLLAVDPDYPPGLVALGSARMAANDIDAAEPLLWQALAGWPSNPGFYFPLAALYRERGDKKTMTQILALGTRKISFYEELPESLATAVAKVAPELEGTKRNPEVYETLADNTEAEVETPWNERLLPYRLLNEVQQQALGGLDPDLIREITAHAEACAPVFEAAVREVYASEQSTLSIESESLLTALLGEIGRIELLSELLPVDYDPREVFLHSHWAAFRLGQRFPAEVFERLRELGRDPDPDVRTGVAQHLYFLREHGDARRALRELADGISFDGKGEGAAYLLMTITTMLAAVGAEGDALEIAQKYARRLSKEGGKFLDYAKDPDQGWLPALLAEGIDELDVEGVCVDLALVSEESPEKFEDEEDFEEVETVSHPPAPGRNDPCWCGSGKKYKKCHLQADEEEARKEQASEPENELVNVAWAQLLDAAGHYHPRTEIQNAVRRFTGMEADDLGAEGLSDSGFFDWYLFDYRSERNGRTVIEEFLRRRGERLTEESRALFEAWLANRYGLWEVVRIESDRGVELKDVFEGDSVFVENSVNEEAIGPGAFLIHRVHRYGDKWQFVGNGFLVKPEAAAAIRQEAHSAAEFRSRSHEWRRFVPQERADEID